MEGYPPKKDTHFSIRNVRHRKYHAFLALRKKAIEAMGGMAWYEGLLSMEFTLYAPDHCNWVEMLEYAGGLWIR